MSFAVRVDVSHMLQILVCEVGVLFGQQLAYVSAGLMALGFSSFGIPANLLRLVCLQPLLQLLDAHVDV